MGNINETPNYTNILLVGYLVCAFLEIWAELLDNQTILIFFKPLSLLLFMALYWVSSTKKSPIFFVAISFLMFTRYFIIFNEEKMLFFGILVYFIHRILMIYYVAKLIKLKDFYPVLIGMIPFLFVFFYILAITSNLSDRNYVGLIVQNILLAMLAGMILSDYIIKIDKKSFWLLFFGLLSITQYFIVIIEKFYLIELSPVSFRLLAIILMTLVNLTFYKFVIETERRDS